jgi:hypothetical protein
MSQAPPPEGALDIVTGSTNQRVGWLERHRVVFVRAVDYQVLLGQPGAKRVPEGVAFAIDSADDVHRLLVAAGLVKES